MTHTLPTTAQFKPLYYVAGKNEQKGSFIWKGAVYNTTDHAEVPVTVAFEGVKSGAKAALRVLSGNGDPYAYNDPHTGVNIVQSKTAIVEANGEGKFSFNLPELSVAVLDTDFEAVKTRDVEMKWIA
jgi:alpha-L-arabinofuranosidase